MRKITFSQAKTANVEVAPANVTLNVTNIRPYKRTEMKTFSDVIKKSIHAYELQMVKTCEVRLMCIEHFASQKFDNMNRFWTLYMERADELLDSRRFLAEAKKLGADPILLATNIVARGVGLVNQVAKFGIRGSGIDISEFCCSLVPDVIVKKFMSTPEGLFPSDEAEQEMESSTSKAPIAKTASAA